MRFLILAVAICSSACASSPDRESVLVVEAKQEPEIGSSTQIRERLNLLIQQDTDLPEAKKQALMGIIAQVFDSNHELQILFNQKKSLYVKELLKTPFDPKKAQLIASSMEKLNRTQMRNLFDGVAKMKKELGLEVKNANRMMNHFLEGGGRW